MPRGIPRLVVVLVEPESPGNVGFVARVLANFGVSELRIVGPDVRDEDYAIMFAVHAKTILESSEIHTSLESAIKDTDSAWAATARYGGYNSVSRALVPLPELPNPTLYGRVALVFGRESAGLTNEEIAQCDLSFTIPVSEQYSSMNLSHAVAVTLYSLFERYNVADSSTPRPIQVPSTKEEREQVCKFFDEIVDELPLKDFRRPIAKQVFRNIMGRAYMTGREVATMTGTTRKIRNCIKGCAGKYQATP
ncbi:MAG: RNA methyltransferase [Candidatus Thorarchaeota archaeon]|nr:RNA methyltransferase [Candidatus Thorarchaeota archaeon]